jgi:PhnB protein
MKNSSKNQSVRPVPEGYRTVTPYLVVDNAAALIEFIERAFGGKLMFKMGREEDHRIMHAVVTIGDSSIMLADTMEGMPVYNGMLYLYLDNVDETYKKAIEAKATPVREPKTEFYGDRSGAVKDEWGNTWWIATHVEDVNDEELQRRAKEMSAERQKEKELHAH